MKEKIEVFTLGNVHANIKQTSMKRDWMDQTEQSHAYRCFPVGLANTLGYEISFPTETSFIWDGNFSGSGDHVKIISGSNYAYSGRGHATVSFETNLVFKTSENITLLQMPVPNLFIDGIQSFTTLISSSFLKVSFPLALRITRPNQLITIPANCPVSTIIPIPLKEICDIEMDIYQGIYSNEFNKEMQDYGIEAQKINQSGEWTDWYRNATNHKKENIGKHELKSIKLKINDYTQKQRKTIV